MRLRDAIKPEYSVIMLDGRGLNFATDEDQLAYNQHRLLDMLEELIKNEFALAAIVDVLTASGYIVKREVA